MRNGEQSDATALGAPIGMRFRTFEHEREELLVVSYALGAPAFPEGLTVAERGVALGILKGWSVARIARDRGVSRCTVANQVRSIYDKVGVSSRLELARVLRAGNRVRA